MPIYQAFYYRKNSNSTAEIFQMFQKNDYRGLEGEILIFWEKGYYLFT